MRRKFMTHTILTAKNKQIKTPRMHFQRYLYNYGEPIDNNIYDIPEEVEAKLLENSHVMRRAFRHTAKKLRASYS